MNNQEIIKKIIERKSDIFCRLIEKEKRVHLFGDYISLCQQYNEKNIGQAFEGLYRGYWAMNGAGLTLEHFRAYFNMLQRGEMSLDKILKKLYDIPRHGGNHALLFSFATKLIHTLDNNRPIFDRWVGLVFWGNNIFNNEHESLYEKIRARVLKYDELCRRYRELLSDKSIINEIQNLRHDFTTLTQRDNNFKWDNKIITDVRVLDFMVWELGQILFRR